MVTYWGSGGVAPPLLISALDGGKWSASRPGCSFPPPPPTEKRPRYPLDRRLGVPQSRSGLYGVEKNILTLLGIETRQSNL
jgi:hypothetical protein